MRILWFTNSPCGSIRRDKGKCVTGGWLVSLEDEIKNDPELELNVAFFSSKEEIPFFFEGVRYYPIYVPTSKSKVIHILERRRSHQSLDMLLLPKMLDVVKNVNPSLIHIHGTERSFGLIQEYVKEIPVVFSIQGLLAPYSEKFFSGIPCDYTMRKEKVVNRLKGVDIKRVYGSFLYGGKRECAFLKNAKFIMGRTSWDKNITGLLNPSREYFTVNEILRSPFYVKQWNKKHFNDERKIVSIISPGIYKGLETLLKSAYLLKTYSKVNFLWNVVGLSCDSDYVKQCEEYTKIKSHDVNVRYLGIQGAEILSDILVESDIYCHVSHIENSPNSVCEAMLIGMPIVATFAGGTNSILKDGVEGYLVQDGDPYSTAGTIQNMANSFDTCHSLGLNARVKAAKRHNPKNVAKELLESYHKIMNIYGNNKHT